MVLLGEQDELNYRLMKRRLVDLLSLAPVAGLQTYLRDRSVVVEATGPAYVSPQGGNTAPLRNMRVARVISAKHLLDDGAVRIYHIRPQADAAKGRLANRVLSSPSCLFMVFCTWIIWGGLLAAAFVDDGATWIGKANLLAFGGWSVFLRVADNISFAPGFHRPSNPDRFHCAIFMGRRHSAFVLEGSRADIALWTSSGLALKDTAWVIWLGRLSRLGTLLLLVFIFTTIPNGSPDDQVLFVTYNILGQIGAWLGQRLHADQSFERLQLVEEEKTTSRTHVYANLLRKYGDDVWVNNAGLIPQTPTWDAWRVAILDKPDADAKALWEQCDADATASKLR